MLPRASATAKTPSLTGTTVLILWPATILAGAASAAIDRGINTTISDAR